MALHSSNLDYYNRMEELEERLKRSEEERMLLQRQFDLLMQANHEKERARVSVVEARYKRFLDEDKRRRDRNSSLLQALDRIDSHTANLAAKTERMRALRKHYEAFIAHSYPAWHGGIDRSYCPLAAIAPAPNVMTRVTEVTGYNTESSHFRDPGDYSETQYHALPSLPSKPYSALTSSLCHSDLAIPSREDCPVARRSPYRGSAAGRSASLSPSRFRDLSSQYDTDKISSFRNYDVYTPSKSPDVGLSPRFKTETSYPRRDDVIASPRPSYFLSNVSQGFNEEKRTPYRPLLAPSHRILDYDHGNSDIEVDQNTSGDLLNLSNLSLSDDGVLNEPDIPDSPLAYSGLSHHSYSSPRDFTVPKKIPQVSLSLPSTSLKRSNSRESFIPKRSGALSPSLYTSSLPKSILSPRSRKSDISSLPMSDSVQRIILSADDFDTRCSDASLSPRRHKPTWQTLRPSYLTPPTRSTMRRSVTFTEPEYESPCIFRNEDVGLYSGSYGSLRRHSPSLPLSSWESSDHEKYLREKQGREKDAFREKIERLKELIQENKDQDSVISGPLHDAVRKSDFSHLQMRDYDQHSKPSSRENSLDRDKRISQSRRPSVAGDMSSDSEEQFSHSKEEALKSHGTQEYKFRNDINGDPPSETISDKEQWSGQFSEKDDDAQEELKTSDIQDGHVNLTKLEDSHKFMKDDDSYSYKPEGASVLEKESESLGEKVFSVTEQDIDKDTAKPNYLGQASSDFHHAEPQLQEEEVSDFSHKDDHQQQEESSYQEEQTPKELSDFKQSEKPKHEQEPQSKYPTDQNQDEQPKNVDYPETYNYEEVQQQKWTANEDGGSQASQQNIPFNYEQSDPSVVGYEEHKNQDNNVKDSGYEQYSAAGEKDQHSYENYQSDTNQQQQVQGEYGDTEYSNYEEPQQKTDLGSGYQEYSDDPNQYQQSYQTYPEDQQYTEQQNQNYNTEGQNNYQYSQDSAKGQYEYDGQEYNYQQNQDDYNYPQDQNYQQDSAYKQDQSYQQDQNYQDQSYSQEQQYQQDPNYQQGQYQEAAYEGSQRYESYQHPGADDLSEDTTTSADVNYQAQYHGGDGTDQQQKLDQYRAVLGADPSSDPAYSDSSELENQMAAVVAQGGSPAASVPEPAVSAPATTPTPTAATAKGKAGAKKKPQLTRKQSSVTPENVDGKQQAASNLPKLPESGPGVTQHQSDSDVSSSH